MFSLAFWVNTATAETTQVEFFYGIAEGNYLIGDLNGASRGVEQMLRLDPDYGPAHELQARILLDEGESEAALAAVERAIALQPDEAELVVLKCLVLGQLGRRDEAMRRAEALKAQHPSDSETAIAANQLIGLLQMAEGNWDAAAAAFQQNYIASPEKARASLQLASEAYLEKAGEARADAELDEALGAIDAAIALNEKSHGVEYFERDAALRLTRVRVLSDGGRWDQAIEELQFLTGRQPENLEATLMLASLYAAKERWASLAELTPLIKEDPSLVEIALYLEGRLALSKNRVGSARAKFEEALEDLRGKDSPLEASLHFYRAVCLKELGREAEAKEAMAQAVDLNFQPETEFESLRTGQYLLKTKSIDSAIIVLERAAFRNESAFPEVWAALGRAHLADKNPALALSAFNRALSISPLQPDVLALRGSLLRRIGDLEGAIADYESVLNIDPDNAAVPFALGIARLQAGQLNEAEDALALAVERQTDNASAHLLHALVAYTIEETEAARTSLGAYVKQSEPPLNESAVLLEFTLNQSLDFAVALRTFEQRAEDHPSLLLPTYVNYASGKATQKTVLDLASKAENANTARKQICAAAFWLAQSAHAANLEAAGSRQTLLELAVAMGDPDLPEFQFARWQLANTPL